MGSCDEIYLGRYIHTKFQTCSSIIKDFGYWGTFEEDELGSDDIYGLRLYEYGSHQISDF